MTPIINLETVSRVRPGLPRRGLPPRSMPEKLSMVTASKRHLRLESDDRDTVEEKCCSLIEWNTDVLLSYLKAVITYRQPVTSRSVVDVDHSDESSVVMPAADLVTDVIVMPEFVPLSQRKQEPSSFELEQAHMELKTFVSEIAVLYNDIPFHNFEVSVVSLVNQFVCCIQKLLPFFTGGPYLDLYPFSLLPSYRTPLSPLLPQSIPRT